MTGSDRQEDAAPSSEVQSAGLSLNITATLQAMAEGSRAKGNARVETNQSVVRIDKVEHLTMSPPIVTITSIYHLPARPEIYIPREGRLHEIQEKLNAQTNRGVTIKRLAIVGISGSGKTELANAYADVFKEQINLGDNYIIYMFNANRILSDYEELAEAIGIKINELRSHHNRKAYKEKLIYHINIKLRDYANVLFIFDNVHELNDIQMFVPNTKGMTVTVLYLSQDTELLVDERLKVDINLGLDEAEAVTLLRALTDINHDGQALALARDLDMLPLAICVAGHYIAYQRTAKRTPGHDYISYQQLYQAQMQTVNTLQTQICQQERTQYAAIELSVTNLNLQGKQLLWFCSLLDYKPIPEALLDVYTRDHMIFATGQRAHIEADVAIRELRKYGLIYVNKDSKCWSLHAITQKYAWFIYKDRLTAVSPFISFTTQIVLMLAGFASFWFTPIGLWLLGLTITLIYVGLRLFMSLPDRSPFSSLLDILQQPSYEDNSLMGLKQQKEIYPHMVSAITKLTSLSVTWRGPLLGQILESLSRWGSKALLLGYTEDAELLFERYWSSYRRWGNLYHVRMASVMSVFDSLMKVYQDLGGLDMATKMLKLTREMQDFHAKQRRRDPNLDGLLAEMMRFFQAMHNHNFDMANIALYQEKITGVFKRMIDARKVSTNSESDAMLRNIAAMSNMTVSRHEQAIALLRQAAGVTGLHHSEMIRVLCSLGEAYNQINDAEQAIEVLNRARILTEENYGTQHRETGKILLVLSNSYGILNQIEQQKKLLKRALAIFEAHASQSLYMAGTLMSLSEVYGKLDKKYKNIDYMIRGIDLTEKMYATSDDPGRLELLENKKKLILYRQRMKIEKSIQEQAHVDVPRRVEVSQPLDQIAVSSSQTGNTPTMSSCLRQRQSASSSSLRKTNSESETKPLFYGIFMESAPTIPETLKSIFDEYKTQDKDKALRNAAFFGHLTNVKILLKYGANVNAQDNNPGSRKTALHHAAIKRHKTIVSLLLAHSAIDVSLVDASGNTAKDYLVALSSEEVSGDGVLLPTPMATQTEEPHQVSLHVHNPTQQAVGDNVSITGASTVSIELSLVKFAPGAQMHGDIHIDASGRPALPTTINNLPQAVQGHLERVQLLERVMHELAIQAGPIKELMLVGVTGSGKTELAKAYARHHLDDWGGGTSTTSASLSSSSSSSPSSSTERSVPASLVYVIDASIDRYLGSFEGLAEQLCIDVKTLREWRKPDSSPKAREEYEQQLSARVHQGLKAYPGWLLLFDSIADANASTTYLRPWIPHQEGHIGTLLFTLQDTSLSIPEVEAETISMPSYGCPMIDITLGLSDDEAITLLQALTGIRQDDTGPALILAKALDKLPLAVQVAGRYIAYQRRLLRIDASDYTTYLAKHQKALALLNKDQEATCKKLGIAKTQYAAIGLSIQSLPPEAKALLDVCGLLCNRGLPEELLRTYTTHFLGQDAETGIETDIAITCLRECGLLNSESLMLKTWFLHQTTHAYTWLDYRNALIKSDVLDEANKLVPISRLLDILDTEVYRETTSPALATQRRAYLPVLAFLRKLTIDLKDYPFTEDMHKRIASGLRQGGIIASHLGETKIALDLFQITLVIFERYYDSAHPAVAITFTNLGSAYLVLGDFKRARDMLERALAILERRYGPMYPEVTQILNDLGKVYNALGDAMRARELLERALAIEEFYHGSAHPRVALILLALGTTYGVLGDLKKKQNLLERVLVIQESHYGPTHPDVGVTLTNLGNAYSVLGDAKRACDLLERGLVIAESHYGQEHPKVAQIYTNLGNVYITLGNTKRACDLLERALVIQESHYGPMHPQVGITLTNLGRVHGLWGNAKRACNLLERALSINENHYGLVHPEVGITLLNLGDAYYWASGDISQTLHISERTFRLFDMVYGKNYSAHPHLQLARIKLALYRTIAALSEDQMSETLPLATNINPTDIAVDDIRQVPYKVCEDRYLQQLIKSHPAFNKKWGQLTQALLLNRLSFGAYYQALANLLLRFDTPLAAISYYERAIESDGVNSTAYHNLACCYHTVNQRDKARETFELGLRYQPKTNLMAEYAHFLWQTGDIPSAINMISRCLSESEDKDDLFYGQAEIAVIEPGLRVLVERYPNKEITLSPHGLVLYLQCLHHHNLSGKQEITDAQPLSAFEDYVCIHPTNVHLDMLTTLYTLYGNTRETSYHQGETRRLREQALSASMDGLSPSNIALQRLINLYKTDDKNKILRVATAIGRFADVLCVLEHGADVNARDSNPGSQKTALHRAAIKGNEEIMTLLKVYGADDSLVDASGSTAKDYLAALSSHRAGSTAYLAQTGNQRAYSSSTIASQTSAAQPSSLARLFPVPRRVGHSLNIDASPSISPITPSEQSKSFGDHLEVIAKIGLCNDVSYIFRVLNRATLSVFQQEGLHHKMWGLYQSRPVDMGSCQEVGGFINELVVKDRALADGLLKALGLELGLATEHLSLPDELVAAAEAPSIEASRRHAGSSRP